MNKFRPQPEILILWFYCTVCREERNGKKGERYILKPCKSSKLHSKHSYFKKEKFLLCTVHMFRESGTDHSLPRKKTIFKHFT